MLDKKIERYSVAILFDNNDTPLNLVNWIVESRKSAYDILTNNQKFKCFIPPPNSTCHEYIVGIHEEMQYHVDVFLDMKGELSAKFSAYAELIS